MALKTDPALLNPTQYAELTNLVSNVEGDLTTRAGNQLLTSVIAFPASGGYINTITRLRSAGFSSFFVGSGDKLFYSADQLPSVGAGMTFTDVTAGLPLADPNVAWTAQRWGSDDYTFDAASAPYKFIGAPLNMRKVGMDGITKAWGMSTPPQPATATNTTSPSGPTPFVGAETPYRYVYTSYDPLLKTESNPSMYMLPSAGITPNGFVIRVVVGFPTGTGSVLNVYRSGGNYADGLYRYVGQVLFSSPFTGVFFDTLTDPEIASAKLLETDNDPPVPATLQIPLVASLVRSGSSTFGPGFAVVTVTGFISAPIEGLGPLTPGTMLTIDTGVNQESVIIAAINKSTNTLSIYPQLAHDALNGTTVTCYSVAGSPATIVLSAFDAMFVAGDPFNPHVLYKSKNGAPDSFGVLEQATGIVKAVNVGSPSDPIMGLAEYGNSILALKRDSLYSVVVYQGAMSTPEKTPARRGVLSRAAWVRVSNSVWYVSYDGVYTYTGGEEEWASLDIDPLFHGINIGPYLPVDLRQNLGDVGADVISMVCDGNEIFINHMDSDGQWRRFRFHLKLQRWSIEMIGDPLWPSPLPLPAQYADDGVRLIAKVANGRGIFCRDGVGFTDGWVNQLNDGLPIDWSVQPAPITMPPGEQKLFSDLTLELANDSDPVQVYTYYNYSASQDATDSFTVAPLPGRRRIPRPYHNSLGFEAWSVQQKLFGSGNVNLYSLSWNYWDLAQYRRGLAFDWEDLGYPDEKTLRVLNIEMDTGGFEAFIQLQGDGANIGPPISITTTALDRNRIFALPSGLTVRMVRPVITPAQPGGAQTNYYKHSFEFVKEPPALTWFDSLQLTFGYDGYSWMKQAWFMYFCLSPITVSFYSDNAIFPFFTVTLPAHPFGREVERFYLPPSGTVNGTLLLNKSKRHEITIQSQSPFRIYSEATVLEWLPCGIDQRQGYQQFKFSELSQPAATS